MNHPLMALGKEGALLSAEVARLAAHASDLHPTELALRWKALERPLLTALRASEPALVDPVAAELAGTQRSLSERARNLAWEVSVSIDLQAAHLSALKKLALLLNEAGGDGDGQGAARSAA